MISFQDSRPLVDRVQDILPRKFNRIRSNNTPYKVKEYNENRGELTKIDSTHAFFLPEQEKPQTAAQVLATGLELPL